MSLDELITRIAAIAEPYFSDLSLATVRDVAARLPPEEPVFTQVSQFKSELQLEIGYCSGGILVDVTYRAGTWQETLIRIRKLDYVIFKKASDVTDLGLHSVGYSICYTASVESYRSALEGYWRSLENRLER
jgi:hypothetical protein